MKWVFLLLAAVTPAAAQCSYSISPNQISIPANGGSGSVTVTTQGSCAWSFSSGSPWLTLTSGDAINGQVTGSGSVTFTATASTMPTSQQATITIGEAQGSYIIPVTQGAAVCSMTLQPAAATIGVSGGSNSFGVQTTCSWTATSNSPWIAIGGNSSGAGGGTVTYNADANACVDPRSGSITVTSQPAQLFTVVENGSPANLTLSPGTLSAPQAGISGRFNVVTGVGCNWSSFTDVGWLHINTSATGSGNGGIGYTIDANTGSQRSGSIHVGAQLFTVTQAGVAAPTVQLTSLGSAASYVSTAVAPGEIVALFGSNMGPATGVGPQISSDGKSITTTLGGVQVLFDGNPVPMIYASATQINAIAPVGLAGKTSTQVQVSYQGMKSNAVSVPVQATMPGIFSADGSGTGGGAILNQDYTVNARLNPVNRGSSIAIYLTGAGVTNPASVDGAITGGTAPFPSVAQPVSVTIGGVTVPAQAVVYSGAAPQQVEGLIQVNVTIPSNITPGPTIPIAVTIGGVSSQIGITVSVN